MNYRKRNQYITLKAGYLLTVVASGVLQACQINPNPLAGQSLGRNPEESRAQLTNEELESLVARQESIIAAGSAFVEAAAKWEAKAQRTGSQGTSGASKGPIPKETMDGMTLVWMTVLRSIENSAIGYAWEGRRGEFLYCSGRSTGAVRITRNGEELELLKPDANGIPTFIGVVRKTGEYIPITRFRKRSLGLENAPTFWVNPNTGSELKALQPKSPILCAKRSSPKRPSGALGWLFPTSDGNLVCAAENVDPIENVLWVVQNGTDLDIVHSGPDYSGYYARISPDCNVTFQVPFEDSPNTDWSDATWHIADRSGRPTFNASALSGHVLPARLEEPNITLRIHSDGTLSASAPPLAD